MNNFSFAREEWRQVNMGEGFVNESRLEISNFGHIRAFNKITKGKILKGSMINGYRIIRQKLFKPRDITIAEELQTLQAAYFAHAKKLSSIKKALLNESIKGTERTLLNQEFESENQQFEKAKKIYTAFYNKDLKKRTTYYAVLIHRLVAENFIERSSDDQTVVAHLDYDKLNNQVSNLKWMTPEENSKHQQLSPNVIAEKQKRKQSGFNDSRYHKLSITKVMYLKKLLNEGKPIRNLAKQFKISETQIVKIKQQQSWASVEAAK